MNYFVTSAALAGICFICATVLAICGHANGAIALFVAGPICVPSAPDECECECDDTDEEAF